MECPACRAVNREHRRFCAGCGEALPWICATCGFGNGPADAFCGGCGRGFLPRIPPETAADAEALSSGPERRQLTMLFCDVVGSTAISSELDPEDLFSLVQRYQHLVRLVVERYEGFVAQLVGDGVLAYFGHPRAHEDDAVRAVHAAIDIVAMLRSDAAQRDAEQHPLHVRIGIATGRVVVGDQLGQGIFGQIEAVGQAPNLAARIQSLAGADEIVVTASTRSLVGGGFVMADLGRHDLRGIPEPQQLWRVLGRSGVANRFEAAHPDGATPMFGRRAELDRLQQSWLAARRGNGSAMLVYGEAGIGKSRLVRALLEELPPNDGNHVGLQCSPFHACSALHPVARQIEQAAGIAPSDDGGRRSARLRQWVQDQRLPDPHAEALLAALLDLPVDSDMDPLQRRQRTLAMLVALWSSMATRAPLLLVVEDAHWIDPTTAELLGRVASASADLRLLLLITSRSGPEAPWLQPASLMTLALDKLPPPASAELVTHLLPGNAEVQVVDALVARGDGVPLYLEELTREIVSPTAPEPARADARVPTSLQDLLTARLDALGSAKEVAQVAAVIGREFSGEQVAVLTGGDNAATVQALQDLCAARLVLRHDPSPAATHVFRHALLQDAAYASLLRSRRQELHARLAHHLDRTGNEDRPVPPEIIAHHYAEAGLAESAARHWAAAARRALQRSAHAEALSHAQRGLQQLARVPAGPAHDELVMQLSILEGVAHRAVSGFASALAEDDFMRALALAARLDQTRALIEARRGLFACYYARGALALAQEQGRELVALGSRLADPAPSMLGHWMLGCITFWQGDFAVAREQLEAALSMYDRRAHRSDTLALQIDPGINASLHLSWTLWMLGCPEQAARTSRESIRASRDLAQPFALAMTLFWACTTLACCGRQAEVREALDELIAVTDRFGLRYLRSCGRVLEGQYLIAHDCCREGLEEIGGAFAEFRSQQAGLGLPWAMSVAATGHAGVGRVDQGLELLNSALRMAQASGECQWLAELQRLRGELLLRGPDATAEAERCFHDALACARRQRARSLELRAATSFARLLAARGDSASARETLSRPLATFTEGLETADLRLARELLQTLG